MAAMQAGTNGALLQEASLIRGGQSGAGLPRGHVSRFGFPRMLRAARGVALGLEIS